jgi:hypothetical protein
LFKSTGDRREDRESRVKRRATETSRQPLRVDVRDKKFRNTKQYQRSTPSPVMKIVG